VRKRNVQKTGWAHAAGTTVPKGIVGERPNPLFILAIPIIMTVARRLPYGQWSALIEVLHGGGGI